MWKMEKKKAKTKTLVINENERKQYSNYKNHRVFGFSFYRPPSHTNITFHFWFFDWKKSHRLGCEEIDSQCSLMSHVEYTHTVILHAVIVISSLVCFALMVGILSSSIGLETLATLIRVPKYFVCCWFTRWVLRNKTKQNKKLSLNRC